MIDTMFRTKEVDEEFTAGVCDRAICQAARVPGNLHRIFIRAGILEPQSGDNEVLAIDSK